MIKRTKMASPVLSGSSDECFLGPVMIEGGEGR